MLRVLLVFSIASVIVGCSHKSSSDSSLHDINYYRHNFDEAQQRVNDCKAQLKYDQNYTENHQDCKDAFYVVFLDFSMESARHSD